MADNETTAALKYGIVSYDKENDVVNFATAGFYIDAPACGAYVSRDLVQVISIIIRDPTEFQNGNSPQKAYFPNFEDADYAHFSSEAFSFRRMGKMVEEKTGKKVNFIETPSPAPELAGMTKYFNEYGMSRCGTYEMRSC